ncbi:hypothetical protein B296_00001068 [Ensete ventricosum]|uniref:Uncharacterized protein n=1 Tax=Ensete ventricosum TaxID=4639 RepID=A0A427BB92_ENSVE|nr:hypothetical protein B296_00001068 [Ensete ventricosum]
MGRSDSSKPMPDGQPQQHFEGSYVSPRDQVGCRSGIRGGAARPPYDSTISRGTTRVRLSVLTSSPPTGIKHPIVILETTRETNRPTLRTWTIKEALTHAGGLYPHRRWRTCALGREQVKPTPQ